MYPCDYIGAGSGKKDDYRRDIHRAGQNHM
jgi:hypothetical protein